MANKYYKTFDFFNMKSAGGLHIISHFKTMLQTTEFTCAPVCAIMVLAHLGITPPPNLTWQNSATPNLSSRAERV